MAKKQKKKQKMCVMCARARHRVDAPFAHCRCSFVNYMGFGPCAGKQHEYYYYKAYTQWEIKKKKTKKTRKMRTFLRNKIQGSRSSGICKRREFSADTDRILYCVGATIGSYFIDTHTHHKTPHSTKHNCRKTKTKIVRINIKYPFAFTVRT